MDPITTAIIAALAAGTAKGLSEASAALIPDAYEALKTALKDKFGGDSDLVEAVDGLEAKPDSTARAAVVEEEVKMAEAHKDPDLLALAQDLNQALEASGGSTGYQATLSGKGAQAVGPGAEATAAIGKGSIAIGSVGRDATLNQPSEKQDSDAG